ncbi:MAG: UDP-glucose 4-epimerase GalE [Gammaproteobacteria bacterium]|nr:UDP-glucose 4-epimerase GalE [Gammaproteobacteria bacterium]
MKTLVTGGAGYIGSHTAIELRNAGHEVVVLDNLSNSTRAAVTALRSVTRADVPFVECDIRDATGLDRVFSQGGFDAVLHFAALKAVGESTVEPLRYYDNNVAGSTRLLERMAAHGVKTLVFSSSAAIYGNPASMPIRETCPPDPRSPYARTKLIVEDLLRDLQGADPDWRISILRYFNAVGAHPSGAIGEDPCGIPNNLLPFIAQVAVGRRERLSVLGDDYPTPDGTGIRDYLHVVDLARGHLKALDYLGRNKGISVHNLGTGEGSSVFDVVRAFERASGRSIPYQIAGRRAGDVVVSYADPSKAGDELGWTAKYDLDRICSDLWRWQSTHPHGFRDQNA